MKLKQFFAPQSPSSTAEKIVSSVGAAIGISLIFYISFLVTDFHGAMAILPSMGAAAVLLFAVPHGVLSQPWALFVGNGLSAIVGVSCALWIPDIFLAAGLAVGLSIAAMHVCRCTHPPGGATALAAVIGGEGIHQLGFSYVLYPTLLNCMIIFSIAVVFNNLFAWRRYPSSLMRYQLAGNIHSKGLKLTIEHIEKAISDLDVVIDIEPQQIKAIVDMADVIMREAAVNAFDLELGAFYTNGLSGRDWAVRQVIDHSPHENGLEYLVIYRTVEGESRGRSGSCPLDEFAEWAHEKMRPRD